MKKKLLAFALAASMVVTLAPAAPANVAVSADAATTDYVAEGNSYVNPFAGRNTAKGVEMSFKVTKKSQAVPSVFATLIAFNGAEKGKLFFNEGTNLGFNTEEDKNEWFDANMFDYSLVQDYLTEGTSTVKLTFKKTGYEVSVNGKKAYDQSILDDTSKSGKGAGFTASTYTTLLNFLKTADTLDFGKGSPWDVKPNVTITDFVAKCDGEVLDFDKITVLTEEKRSYAQLPSFEGKDFTNGITMTADFSVSGWTNDWTPIFALGDGTIGGGIANPTTIRYALTQGFSSVGCVRASTDVAFADDDANKIGYFGNAINAPYAWDYFSQEANRNTWNNITLTISDTNMITYINGVEVQSAAGDYAEMVHAFSRATGNYLGGSYFSADADFLGSLDNVAIYNKVLTADQIKAMAMSAPSTDKAGSDLTKVEDEAICKYTFDTNAGDLILQDGATVKDGALVCEGAQIQTSRPQRASVYFAYIDAAANTKVIEGMTNVSGATVKVKVGSAAYKKAKVTGTEFKYTASKVLTPGTKIRVRIEKTGYATTWQDKTVAKLNLKISGVTFAAGKVTGKVSTSGATVKVKIGKAKYKKATVKGTKFTFKSKNIKAGKKATVTIQASHKYAKKAVTKKVSKKVPAKKSSKK